MEGDVGVQGEGAGLLEILMGVVGPEVVTVSQRLGRWCQAFEAWLEWVEAEQGHGARQQGHHAWALLLGQQHCLPWQLKPAELEAWQAGLVEEGYGATTIRNYRGHIRSFYRFCARRPDMRLDPLLASTPDGSGYADPFRLVATPRCGKDGEPAQRLGPGEVQALLRAVDRDSSVLGRRDYALLLTLLLSGMPTGGVRALKWGDVAGEGPGQGPARRPSPTRPSPTRPAPTEAGHNEGRGNDGPARRPAPTGHNEGRENAGGIVPEAAREAIEAYLRASGRLGTIQPGDYVFAPLAEALRRPMRGEAADWDASRPISARQAEKCLKRYAAWAGLAERRVTFTALRESAAALQMEGGHDPAEAQGRLSGRSLFLRHIRRGGKRERCPWTARNPLAARQLQVPTGTRRRQRGGQPGQANNLKHGFYSTRELAETPELEGVDLDQLHRASLEQEIEGLRLLMARLVRYSSRSDDPEDSYRAVELFGQAAARLAQLMEKQAKLQAAGAEREEDEMMAAFKRAVKAVTKEFGWGDGGAAGGNAAGGTPVALLAAGSHADDDDDTEDDTDDDDAPPFIPLTYSTYKH